MTAPAPAGLDPATAAVLAQMARDEVTAEVGTPSLYTGRVVASAATLRERIVAEAQQLLRTMWREVNPWKGQEVERFARQAADITVAVQQQAGRLAVESEFAQLDALDLRYREVIEIPAEVRGTDIDPEAGIVTPTRRKRSTVTYTGDTPAKPSKVRVTVNGDPAEAYNRPARKFRFLVTEGMDIEAAMEQATQQLDTITDTNATLAGRLGEAEALRRAAKAGVPILGQRRVVHPELSRGGTCGLCLVAADREYKVGTLAPIHDHCNCTTSPITLTHDPGSILNAVDLERLYGEAGGTGRDVLKRTRYQVDEHGELVTVFHPKAKAERTTTTRPTGRPDPKTPADRLPFWQAPNDELRRRVDRLRQAQDRRARLYGDEMPRDVANKAASDLAALTNLTEELGKRGLSE